MNILKAYLSHLIYIPIGILYLIGIGGEDANTRTLFLGIIISFAMLAYIVNVSIYYLTLKLSFGKKLLSALMPSILAILFYSEFNNAIGGFDIGPVNGAIGIITITTIINIAIYFLDRKINPMSPV